MHRKTSKPVNITRAWGQEVYYVLYIHISSSIEKIFDFWNMNQNSSQQKILSGYWQYYETFSMFWASFTGNTSILPNNWNNITWKILEWIVWYENKAGSCIT